MDVWFYILGGLIFLLVLALFIGWQSMRPLLGLRLCASPLVLADRAELPAALASCFAPAETALQTLGFKFEYCIRFEDTPGHIHWQLVFQHPERYASASVLAAPPLSQGAGYRIVFGARDSTRYLLTANGYAHQMLPLPPMCILQDGYHRSMDKHWQLHCETMAQFLDEPIWDSAEQSFARSQELRKTYFEHLIQSGWLRHIEDNQYAMPLARALRLLWAMIRGENRAKKRGANLDYPRADAAADPEQQIQRAQADYQKMRDYLQQRPLRGSSKLLLSLVSLVVFMLVFRLAFSWEMVLVLVGVLLFHEGGHLLAMRWFGYRDLNVLFIPALGAVATAQKHDASVAQKVIVALAGPLPGLLLGGVLLMFYWPTDNTWLTQLIMMLLVLNYFNLLPIMPLDGGQVMNELLFRRHPRWQAAFLTLGVLAICIMAWALDAYVLGLAALVLALGLPAQWRFANALNALRRTLRTQTDLSKAVFGLLQQPRFQALGSGRRYHLAHYLFANAKIAPASKKLISFTLALHLTLLVLPAGLLLQVWNPWALASFGNDSVYEPPDWSVQLATAADDSARWRILSEASEWHYYNEDYMQAATLAGQAAALALTFGENDPRLALSWRQQALVEDDPAVAQKLLEQALALQERVLGLSHPELIETLQALAWNRGSEAIPEQIALLQRALLIAAEHNDAALKYKLYNNLGVLHENTGQAQAAEGYFKQAAAPPSSTDQEHESMRYLWPAAQFELARFYQRQHNIAAAVAALTVLQEQTPEGDNYRLFSQSALAWLYVYQGQFERAEQTYQAILDGGVEDDLELWAYQRPGLLLQSAYIEQQTGQPDRARDLAQKALALLQDSALMSPAQYRSALQRQLDWQNESNESAVERAKLEAELGMLDLVNEN